MPALSPDCVILGLLEYQSCHGYHLLDHFRAPTRLGNIWKLSTSQLYTTLKRLERAELIDGREEDSVDAPIKTVYWLTSAGRAMLYDWLHESHPSPSTRHIRTEFLSRLYIAKRLKLPFEPIVEAQLHTCQAYRERLIAQQEQMPPGVAALALKLRIAEMDVILDWIETCTDDRLLDNQLSDEEDSEV